MASALCATPDSTTLPAAVTHAVKSTRSDPRSSSPQVSARSAQAHASTYAADAAALGLWQLALRAAERCGLPKDQAEDSAQRTLLYFWESQATIQHPRAWVLTVARRTSMDIARNNSRHSLVDFDRQTYPRPHLEQRLDIESALNRLGPDSALVARKYWIEGHSILEVCESTGLSASTVKRRLKDFRRLVARATCGASPPSLATSRPPPTARRRCALQ